jgi:cell division protein ZapA (FtsZ GTPase activity inhibitor)
MAKDENKTIFINDKEYNLADFNEQEIAIINHIQDLDRKLANAKFNVDQLAVGREAFVAMLNKALEEKDEEAN